MKLTQSTDTQAMSARRFSSGLPFVIFGGSRALREISIDMRRVSERGRRTINSRAARLLVASKSFFESQIPEVIYQLGSASFFSPDLVLHAWARCKSPQQLQITAGTAKTL